MITKKIIKTGPIAIGLAMFAMFFGAGNVVFPLQLGQISGDKNNFAILGMLITAVLIPFAGLMAMVLFGGKQKDFFYRIGKIPGFSLIVLSMVIIGPFIGIPRCIGLSYSIFKYSFPNVNSLWQFSIISCLIIYLLCLLKTRIVDLYGYLLTPLLLGFLFFIILRGIFVGASPVHNEELSNLTAFFHGFIKGYHTLDLLAALFFSGLIYLRVQQEIPSHLENDSRSLINICLKASIVGAVLLALIYAGMSYVISFHTQHESVLNANSDQLIAAISFAILGNYAGITASSIAALSCLTTAITLTVIASNFLSTTIFRGKLSYHICLIIILCITFAMSLLGFSGILNIIAPITLVLYPTFLVLSLFNIIYKLYGFEMIKTPVLITLITSFLFYY